MKYYNNSVFSATIAILIFILNIKNIKGASTKCSECTYDYSQNKCIKGAEDCPSYCRPHFYRSNCYDCSEVFKTEATQFYSIENNKCRIRFAEPPSPSISDIYIISETNEFVKADNIYEENRNNPVYIFGYFVYNQCPYSLSYDTNTLTREDSTNDHIYLCRCESLTYSTEIFRKDNFKCVTSCPFGYNMFTTDIHLCKNQCDSNFPRIITSNYTCVDNCRDNEYYFYYTLEGKQYCSNRCPSSAPFYYPRSGDNEVVCKDKCDQNDFYFSNTKICTEKCSEHKSLIDIEKSIFICDESLGREADCPPNFPYKYKHSCLRKCSDTFNDYFTQTRHFEDTDLGKIRTYSLIKSDGKKKCVEDCTNDSESDKNYYDLETYTCIGNCTETSKKYINGNQCVNSCDGTGNNFHNYGKFNCINDCNYESAFKYKSTKDKICYDDCTKFSNIFYYDKDKKQCYFECSIDSNPRYILKKNNILYCLDNCKNVILNGESTALNYFHRHNDYTCIESCEENSDISPYYYIKDESNNVCYQSCKDANNNYKYEYDSGCYTIIKPIFSGKLHYTMNSSIIKFISPSENEKDFCSKAGYYYTKIESNANIGGKKCENCGNEYKIPYSFDTLGNIENLGECLGSTKCNTNYPYYTEDKICHEVCSFKKLVNINSPESIVNSEATNCVKKCNVYNFKYESSDGTKCYNECPSTEPFYYQIETNIYKCIKDCTNITMFYNDGQNGGACIDKCSSYPYYIPGNIDNKCLSTCKDQAIYKFSLQGSSTNPQPCLKECPLRFQYYDDNNTCLPNCDGKFISEEKKCVPNCENSQYIINENECADDCTKNATFLDGRYNGPYKCDIKCDSGHSFYYEIRKLQTGEPVYKCISNCHSDGLLEFGKRCVSICPNETFQEDYKCKLKCASQTNFKRTSMTSEGIMNYLCQNGCGSDYIASTGECIAKCPREENFFLSNKRCQNYCDNFYRKTNQIGTDQFGSYIIYECINNCGTGEKLLDGTKECATECNDVDKPYLLGGKTCVSICLKDQITPFSATVDGRKECATKCSASGSDPKYFGDDKICISDCGIFEHKKYHNEKENEYSCVSHCDLKSENRFL